MNDERVRRDARDPAYTIAFSACQSARDLGLAALVIPTLSGRSARLISAHRPDVPIYCLSPGHETIRRCNFMWGVESASIERIEITEELIAASARRAVELGWVKPGERIGITAGLPSGQPAPPACSSSDRLKRSRDRSFASGGQPVAPRGASDVSEQRAGDQGPDTSAR